MSYLREEFSLYFICSFFKLFDLCDVIQNNYHLFTSGNGLSFYLDVLMEKFAFEKRVYGTI